MSIIAGKLREKAAALEAEAKAQEKKESDQADRGAQALREMNAAREVLRKETETLVRDMAKACPGEVTGAVCPLCRVWRHSTQILPTDQGMLDAGLGGTEYSSPYLPFLRKQKDGSFVCPVDHAHVFRAI